MPAPRRNVVLAFRSAPSSWGIFYQDAAGVLGRELFTIHGVKISLTSLLLFTLTFAASVLLGRATRRALLRLLRRRGQGQEEGSAYALARIAQYAVSVAGVLLALENVGVTMTSLAALGAVFAVGLGFGLQNIAQNFISGLILLIERPVAKGDVVIVDGTFGVVDEISIRATRIMTFDSVAMIVPNNKLISEVVENRSEPDTTYRIRVDVGVAYGSDTREVESVLLDLARNQARVLATPEPTVYFVGFGSSSLDFQLCFWLDDPAAGLETASEMRHAIVAAFAERRIEIPFPQRDLHLKTVLQAPQALIAAAPTSGGSAPSRSRGRDTSSQGQKVPS